MEKYELSILPLFKNDMLEAVTYITEVLNNPSAASKLINETEKTIYKRLDAPLSFSPYKSKNKEMTFITVFLWGILLSFMWSREMLWRSKDLFTAEEILKIFYRLSVPICKKIGIFVLRSVIICKRKNSKNRQNRNARQQDSSSALRV